MRKKRGIGDQSFPEIRQFFSDIIKALVDGSTIWVTEDRRPKTIAGHQGFDEAVAYHFIARHQPLGARRPVRYTIAIDLIEYTVKVDSDVLRLDMINLELYQRLVEACVERCIFQSGEQPPTQEGKRMLRRLTREFDRNLKPFHRLTRRLGRHGNRIACGRHKKSPVKKK